jgi:hypothetical protein
MPFEPADGRQSRKMYCVELVLSVDVDTQIPISEVMDLCDCDRAAAWAAMREAAEFLERNGERSVATQAPYGWRVIGRGEEMLVKAKKQLDKTARAGSRAARTTTNVDREQLTQFQRQDHDQLVRSLDRVLEIRKRKTRSLAEISRMAKRADRPDPRVRQLPNQRREEGA